MCRLAAITNGGMNPDLRRMFAALMLTGAETEGNNDGYGISDGNMVWKTSRTVDDTGYNPLSRLDHNSSWLLHTRAASRGLRNDDHVDNHPYIMTDSNGHWMFVGAHNGFVRSDHFTHDTLLDTEPKTDSYQAMLLLRYIMLHSGSPIITDSIIHTWINQFESTSEFSFMLQDRRGLIVIRGNRPMYRVNINGTWLFNTSANILMNALTFADTTNVWNYYNLERFSPDTRKKNDLMIDAIGEFTIVRIAGNRLDNSPWRPVMKHPSPVSTFSFFHREEEWSSNE